MFDSRPYDITTPAGVTDEAETIAGLDLTVEEQRAVSALEARIRVLDPTWGDSLNDFDAIARVILAARKAGVR